MQINYVIILLNINMTPTRSSPLPPNTHAAFQDKTRSSACKYHVQTN